MHSKDWVSMGYRQFCPDCKTDVTPEGAFYFDTGGDVAYGGASEVRCPHCGGRFKNKFSKWIDTAIYKWVKTPFHKYEYPIAMVCNVVLISLILLITSPFIYFVLRFIYDTIVYLLK